MKKYLSIIFTMFLVFALHAQSADVITDILNTERVTFGQVCYVSAVEQGLIDEKDDYDIAIEALVANELIPEVVEASLPIPLVDAVYVMSNIWDIKGGLMFILTNGSPRYCFKQFKADGVLDEYQDPRDYISGPELLNIYNTCLTTYGSFDVRKVSMEAE